MVPLRSNSPWWHDQLRDGLVWNVYVPRKDLHFPQQLEAKVHFLGCRVPCIGFEVHCLWFRVQGFRFRTLIKPEPKPSFGV